MSQPPGPRVHRSGCQRRRLGRDAGRRRRGACSSPRIAGFAASLGSMRRARWASPTNPTSTTRSWRSTCRAGQDPADRRDRAARPAQGARTLVRTAGAAAVGPARARPRPARVRSRPPVRRASAGGPIARRRPRPAAPPKLLVVPHPSAAERLFVLAPLADLAPGLVPPGWGRSVERRVAEQADVEGPDAVRADRYVGRRASGPGARFSPGSASAAPFRRLRPRPADHPIRRAPGPEATASTSSLPRTPAQRRRPRRARPGARRTRSVAGRSAVAPASPS